MSPPQVICAGILAFIGIFGASMLAMNYDTDYSWNRSPPERLAHCKRMRMLLFSIACVFVSPGLIMLWVTLITG